MAETNRPLSNRILIGLVVGIIAGVATLAIGKFSPDFLAFMRKVSTNVFDPFGQIFLRMLFFVVIPLVFASLATGILQLGRLDKLGPLAGRTFTLFFLNMGIGVGLGLIMMNVLQPGDHLDPAAKTRLLEEFRQRLVLRGFAIATADAGGRAGGGAYSAWAPILPALITRLNPARCGLH